MRLLVTGFPKFDAFAGNSTQALIESMVDDLPEGLADLRGRIAFEIVEFENDDPATQQETMLESFRHVLDRQDPDACLFCGQAASRHRIEIETIAINIFKSELIDPEGPPAYWATLPKLKDLADAMRAVGIPAALSHHAGTHLCNHILYSALRLAEGAEDGMRCGFLHFPMTDRQVIAADENRPFVPLAMMREALTMAIRHVCTHLTAAS